MWNFIHGDIIFNENEIIVYVTKKNKKSQMTLFPPGRKKRNRVEIFHI